MSSRGKSNHPPCLRFAFYITRETRRTGTLLPSTTSMQAQASSQPYPPSSPLSTFEFTKRKRWADLLITELTEAIILILSTQCQILYCSAAVKELLGWRDEDLIDTEFLDLVNGACMRPAPRVLSFSAHFRSASQSMTARTSKKVLSSPSGTIVTCNPTLGCIRNLRLFLRHPLPAPLKSPQGQQRCCSRSSGIPTI